ncbi:MAG: peptidoglycan bridge formation glycyltransferase FemA/FemB family protein [Patescibacteria group bacterium]|nr:peptidoglycan bridge formation glycyltransferase FemA/FemB family protein [Patescibacteria group bacterium]
MLIKQIVDENFAPIWDKFVAENSSPSSFLQSWKWSKFRKECLGEEIKLFAVYDNNTRINADSDADERGLVAVALFIKRALPGGKFYLNCQRGPIWRQQTTNNKQQTTEILNLLISEIKKIAEKEKIVFIRFQPSEEIEITGAKQVQILKRVVEPNHTALLDLSKSEEEILAGMHEKTRYNIRLAEKREVTIRSWEPGDGRRGMEIFYKLMQQTAKRDGVKIFDKRYYKKLLTVFGGQEKEVTAKLLLAEFESTPLAGILLIKFGDAVIYLHGGSGNKYRDKMPAYALQWAAIKWAKISGCHWYDFWGVAKVKIDAKIEDYAKDRWAGITRFKLGFISPKNGLIKEYPGVKDLILDNFWYNLYRLAKILPFRR